MVSRMADAKHPLVAPQRPNTAAHLIGERLQAEFAVADRQSTRQGIGGAMVGLMLEEGLDRRVVGREELLQRGVAHPLSSW